MNEKYKCDHCGTNNPETFKNSSLTKCCANTKREKGCYSVKDKDGKQYYANGKTYMTHSITED